MGKVFKTQIPKFIQEKDSLNIPVSIKEIECVVKMFLKDTVRKLQIDILHENIGCIFTKYASQIPIYVYIVLNKG